MELEQILAIITPALSGISGLILSAIIFRLRIKSVVKISKKTMEENVRIRGELDVVKNLIIDLNQKILFLAEEAKKNAKQK